MPDSAVDTPTPPELVHHTVSNAVARITLDSPRNRNALSAQLVGELVAALESADADETVRVVLLGAEGRVFCSGADLSEAADGSMQQGALTLVRLQRLIATLTVPVVVRLHGPVRAGGIGLVAAADVVIATDDATFALTEVRLGLAPAAISLTVLPRLTDRAASYVALTGETFTGAEAAAMGLVTRAVPADALDDEVDRVCAALLAGSPQGLRETKALLNADLVAGIDAGGERMAELSARLFGSEEARQAMAAFLSRDR